jgi:hypothetical protein
MNLPELHQYACFYSGKETEISAAELYEAKLKAIDHFKPPKSKRHMISVVLIQRSDGSPVEVTLT